MKLDTAALIRKFAIASVAVALAIGACYFAYKAGCTHGGAGASLESLDDQLVSTWLAIPSLSLSAAVLIATAAASLRRAALLAIAFFVVAIPLAFATLMYIESEANKECLVAKQTAGENRPFKPQRCRGFNMQVQRLGFAPQPNFAFNRTSTCCAGCGLLTM